MNKLLIPLLGITLLTSCNGIGRWTAEATPSLQSTELPGQASPTTIATLPAASDAHLKVQCLDIESRLPRDATSNGVLILDSRAVASDGRYKNFDTYFTDMAVGTAVQISKPQENLEGFAVSPDRKWVAYSDDVFDASANSLMHNLVIAMDNNLVYKVIPWEDGWGTINWLDNERLIITVYTSGNPNRSPEIQPTFLILNPFTNERESLRPDFPGMYAIPPVPNWGGWGESVYDPTLSRVVYLRGDESGPLYYVLWNVQDGQEVANARIIGDLRAIPRWSPDGTRFAFAPSLFLARESYPSYELYSMDRDGQVTRLSSLTRYYPRVYIDDFSWSPDGHSIALWFSFWQDTKVSFDTTANRYLAVLDTTTGWITNYCINGENDASIGLRRYPAPLWSPDSKQIIVQSQISQDSFQTVLVDLQQNRAFKIAEDQAPVGWITSYQ